MNLPVRRLDGAVVLITGGTGSFGNRVAGFIERQHVREIRIFSRDEKKQWEMQQRHRDYRYFIGDIRDRDSLTTAVKGVDYIFHAAALKQVPSCEMYPVEALKTNVEGAVNLCAAARSAGVRVVVALSTDKAVKPVNAMGMTKALMEKIVSAQNQFANDTVYCCVRYGNVMGSRGSVIPLFKRQIDEGRPLTLTDPAMTRFLMTLDQSVDLVIHAMTAARGGEIFVRKAPASTVRDLASAMVRKYSKAGADHPMRCVGIRPGEKMHEVLVNEYEMRRAEDTGDFFTIHPEYDSGKLMEVPLGTEYTSENTVRLTSYEHISALLDAMGDTENYV